MFVTKVPAVHVYETVMHGIDSSLTDLSANQYSTDTAKDQFDVMSWTATPGICGYLQYHIPVSLLMTKNIGSCTQ